MIGRWRRAAHRPERASRDVLRQVRRIDLRTRGLVKSRFAGEYQSVFKGQGIEFAEVRGYLPGDDVRTIDWNVTARLGEPHVKRYVEERELTVLLAVDVSGSQHWATQGMLKAELVAEASAALAMSAMRNNDRVGLLLFSDEIEWFVPPRKGRRHVLRLIRDLLAFRPGSRGTDLASGLDYATRLLRDRAIIFLFSDFQLAHGWDALARALTRATVRHDVVAIRVDDPADVALPEVGLLSLEDPETRERVVVDTSSSGTREAYVEIRQGEERRAQRVFRRLGVDEIRLRTDQPYALPLLSFFRGRERRRRR